MFFGGFNPSEMGADARLGLGQAPQSGCSGARATERLDKKKLAVSNGTAQCTARKILFA